MDVARFDIDGYILEERQRDLLGTITEYALLGTRYYLVRTPAGWRAQLAPYGRARRRLFGPAYGDLRLSVHYLTHFGYLSRR